MTTERILPGLELSGFAPRGEGEWDNWMNANLRKLSALTHLTVVDMGQLPASPADGAIYIVAGGANDAKIAVRDNGIWVYYAPKLGWTAKVQNQKVREVFFDGARWVPTVNDSSERFVHHGDVWTGTLTLDRWDGAAHRVNVRGAFAIQFGWWPPPGVMSSLFLEIVNGGSASLTWPNTIHWVRADGNFQSTPVRSPRPAGTDFMVFWTTDAGNWVYGKFI